MLRKVTNKQRQVAQTNIRTRRGEPTLQVVLWTIWTIAVAVTAYLNWRADVIAQRPINSLGLVIHSVLTGLIGLVVLTVIEIRVEPWRFMDED